ncbi:MAG: von Willebrand factor type A domain-containing protein [Sediminibacterium sp.]|nr:von Willebrand factor type A domain-containing protein [Sediminibacterium sp.]MBX9780976.1 VWA domain-containing protein [Chitinophagaceae bacterium]
MRIIFCICLSLFGFSKSYSQFILKGDISNKQGKYLQGVKILVRSLPNTVFFSGNGGSFSIPIQQPTDSITVSYDGYITITTFIHANNYQTIYIDMLPATAQLYGTKLSTIIHNNKVDANNTVPLLGESYTNTVENSFIETKTSATTNFSLTAGKAAYSNIRRFINNETLVPKDAVRIEEMLNYFNLKLPQDTGFIESFTLRTKMSSCPWNNNNKLFYINLIAPKLNVDSLPASNLVFLIDVSGSMDQPNRLPLLQTAFKLLVDNLREKDTLSIVTYGGNVAIALPPTGGNEKKKIKDIIDSLGAGGETPGENAIRVAYNLAKRYKVPNGNNRVILATDGDFNVGQSNDKELEQLIGTYRELGIYLTCLGVGMGNYKDSKLEALAKKGNGNFSYIDQIQEAEKVLVKEFTQTLFAVANEATLSVRFNPQMIKAYRLIGYENQKTVMADTSNTIEGGELGSAHASMAIFEIVPVKADTSITSFPAAFMQLQYKKNNTDSIPWQQSFSAFYQPETIETIDSIYRFSAAIAAFGGFLKESKFYKNYSLEEITQLAISAADTRDIPQKDFISVLQKAPRIYRSSKKKRTN